MKELEPVDRAVLVESLVQRWPSALVSRDKLKEFSGGVISGRTAANYESLGKGCRAKLIVGKRACYPTEAVAEWLVDTFIRPAKGSAS
jgi:hypothetical protein